MPVSNQSWLATRTLEAVLPELNSNHRLIVVADTSTQPEAASVLDEFSGRPWITVDRTHRHSGVFDAYNFAMQELNIRVIPHGIHDPEALYQAVQRLRGAQRPTEKIRFGMIGNLLPVKGIEVIFKVWPVVARQNLAELHIYGTSDPMYVERCVELGIHYHGPYTATDLPQMLAEIDIGILPAQARETFSYTLSEFFAAGIPVIGSDYGALSDRIEQGVDGLKVAPTDIQAWIDAISLTASDPALRERLKRGVRLPDSLHRMAVRYAELYQEVIQRSKITGISMADNGANQSAANRVVA